MRGERAFRDLAIEPTPAQLLGELGETVGLGIPLIARAGRTPVDVAVRIDGR